jgi:hypothetical protein
LDTSSHASDDTLELYALQRLSVSETEGIEEHLLLCQSCVGRLEEIGAFALTMREELRSRPAAVEPGIGHWFRWLQPRFALPGALALALLGLAIYYGTNRGPNLAPVAALELASLRGGMPTVSAALEIDLTLTDAPPTGGPFRVEVVDAGGARVWSGAAERAAKGIEARVGARLAPGDYFVRLYNATGQLLHEYGFHLVPG